MEGVGFTIHICMYAYILKEVGLVSMNSKDIEECIKSLQEYADTTSVQWIFEFGDKIKYNETLLNRINETFDIMNNDTLSRVETLRHKYMGQFNEIEQRIEEMEKLCDELEDIHDEIEVRIKLNQK